METPSRVFLAIGKVLLAIVLGVVVLLIADVVFGFVSGILRGLFGWPEPASTTRNLLLLGVFVIGLLIYRRSRQQRSSGKGIADVVKATRADKEGE